MSRAGIVAIAVAAVAGIAVGIGSYTFVYARGASYLTNDPAACVNCHIMREQYDGWRASSHRAVAVCNDCHAPHSSVVARYATKAENGFWHSVAFTTGRFHEPIQIRARNRAVTEGTCRACHVEIVEAIATHGAGGGPGCIRCHASAGHLH